MGGRYQGGVWMIRAYDAGDRERVVRMVQAGVVIETVAVAPAFQGKGYGRRMTQFAINRLKERGVDRVLLDVGAPNIRARRLYEGLGFVGLQVFEISRLDLVGGQAGY